ncbi:flagellar hook-basal body complex protein FliE [Falsiroseomonas sp. CW058]|uniref:flagellar hook-basal body complex protein FliE n=1 Tax=Falsiroseomonas sp. CW058 TaxID=3388664 RepID=UPI003D316E7A
MTAVGGIGTALRAYGATAAGAPGAGIGAAGEGFEAALGRAMSGVADSARAADAATQAGLTGGAGTTEVVLAVARAELALQTAVALRDRVVSAYQDVMRMNI